jgi:hypothetical protein
MKKGMKLRIRQGFVVRSFVLCLHLNAPYQFTLLLNLCPLIFGLMLFGWFVSIY